jgi:uncharacterized protein
MSMRRSLDNVDTIKIRISQLSKGLHEYHLTCKSVDLGLDNRYDGNVFIDAVIEKTTREIYLNADVHVQGLFQCDRCLEEFERRISGSYNMFYVYDEHEKDRYPADEVQFINLDTVYIDLADDVRQTVILSVPLKLLCTDDCKGLC